MHIAFLVFFLLFADFAQSQPSPSKKKQVSNAYTTFLDILISHKLFLTRNLSMRSRVIFSQFTRVTDTAFHTASNARICFQFYLLGGYQKKIKNVKVEFHIQDCAGYSGGDGYTSWNSVSRIVIGEVPPPVQ